MNGAELNAIRNKAELLLDKANELIRFVNMIETTELCIKKHGNLVGSKHIVKWTHEVNRRKVLVNELKKELICIM
jgi:hypothetical protein|tara:strand:+ start:13822 stop:14046 length:225 start_codon:yes stop_codon:yes gene_type:complete